MLCLTLVAVCPSPDVMLFRAVACTCAIPLTSIPMPPTAATLREPPPSPVSSSRISSPPPCACFRPVPTPINALSLSRQPHPHRRCSRPISQTDAIPTNIVGPWDPSSTQKTRESRFILPVSSLREAESSGSLVSGWAQRRTRSALEPPVPLAWVCHHSLSLSLSLCACATRWSLALHGSPTESSRLAAPTNFVLSLQYSPRPWFKASALPTSAAWVSLSPLSSSDNLPLTDSQSINFFLFFLFFLFLFSFVLSLCLSYVSCHSRVLKTVNLIIPLLLSSSASAAASGLVSLSLSLFRSAFPNSVLSFFFLFLLDPRPCGGRRHSVERCKTTSLPIVYRYHYHHYLPTLVAGSIYASCRP